MVTKFAKLGFWVFILFLYSGFFFITTIAMIAAIDGKKEMLWEHMEIFL